MPPTEQYEPPGVRFYDAASGRNMVLVTDGPSKGWVCFRGPAGQWVTLREATDDDRARVAASQAQQTVKAYCLGFIFDRSFNVLLMEKTKPRWQTGRFNGIGGKIEPGELPGEAMRREAREELRTPLGPVAIDWHAAGRMFADDWIVWVYTAICHEELAAREDEPVSWHQCYELPSKIIDNLRWLVPLCRARLQHGVSFRINETGDEANIDQWIAG